MNNKLKFLLGFCIFLSVALAPGFLLGGLSLMSIANVVKKQDDEMSLITWIKNRIRKNENANILTCGPTGSGKSFCNLSLALLLDPEFSCDEQIVFNFKQLMTAIKKFNGQIDSPLSKRSFKVIIFEEAQITQNAQNWFDKLSKLLNMLLSTYRHQNIILLVNTPFEDMINSQTRRLFHMIIEMKGKNEKKGLAKIRPKLLDYNAKMKKFYEHSLHVITQTPAGKHVYVKTPHYVIKKPPAHIVDRYEELKTDFTRELNARIERELYEASQDPNDNPEDKGELNPESMQPMIWEIVSTEGYDGQEQLAKRITEERGKVCNISQLNRNILSMRKNGWDIRRYKRK